LSTVYLFPDLSAIIASGTRGLIECRLMGEFP